MPRVEGFETVRQYEALVGECRRLRHLYEEKFAHYRLAFHNAQVTGAVEDQAYARALGREAHALLQAWQETHALLVRQQHRVDRAARIRLQPNYRRAQRVRKRGGASDPPRTTTETS
jgi:hypothetical protein